MGDSANLRGDDGVRRPVNPKAVQFFRSTLLPAAIVVLFGLALFAVSARIWLPGDMAAPAPIG
jgi:hypothetical protein